MNDATVIKSGRVEVRLHAIREAQGDSLPLLLLHGLRESGEIWRAAPPRWPGAVHALDFSGHGESGRILGGHIHSELLATDVDAAAAHLGECAIAGRGLGAYLGLLVAGARPELIVGTLLLPGPGLDGGGEKPVFRARPMPPRDPELVRRSEVDPCLEEIETDVRPTHYAAAFAARAANLIWLENGSGRPPWWHAAREASSNPVVAPELTAAFSALSQVCRARPPRQ